MAHHLPEGKAKITAGIVFSRIVAHMRILVIDQAYCPIEDPIIIPELWQELTRMLPMRQPIVVVVVMVIVERRRREHPSSVGCHRHRRRLEPVRLVGQSAEADVDVRQESAKSVLPVLGSFVEQLVVLMRLLMVVPQLRTEVVFCRGCDERMVTVMVAVLLLLLLLWPVSV